MKAKAKPVQTSKRNAKPSPAKRAKTSKTSSQVDKTKEEGDEGGKEDAEEVYHFIGYVPAYGKVWELDGLKSGPLEVGELPIPPRAARHTEPPASNSTSWMDVVRPALRMKMEKYGGAAEGGDNIRFSLLAIVDGLYENANDELEMLKRVRVALEKRLTVGWQEKVCAHGHVELWIFISVMQVDPVLLECSRTAFDVDVLGGVRMDSVPERTYAKDFGAQRLKKDMEILDMPVDSLISAWERCIQDALRAKVALEDEVMKGARAHVSTDLLADHVAHLC
jgi:ubiquitin carboxyl-terminal hydrolase L5